MLCGKRKVVREVLKISAHALSSKSFSRPEGYYFSYKPTLKFITWLLRLNNEIKKNIRDKLAIDIHSPDCFVALTIPTLKTESGAIFMVRLGFVSSMGPKKYITD